MKERETRGGGEEREHGKQTKMSGVTSNRFGFKIIQQAHTKIERECESESERERERHRKRKGVGKFEFSREREGERHRTRKRVNELEFNIHLQHLSLHYTLDLLHI